MSDSYDDDDLNESVPLIKREDSTFSNLHQYLKREDSSLIPESVNSSPTKPLKFLKSDTPDLHSHQLEAFGSKEFSSSSDTIIDENSDSDIPINETSKLSKTNSIKLHGPKDLPKPKLIKLNNAKSQEPKQVIKSRSTLDNDLFERNFDISASDIDKTITYQSIQPMKSNSVPILSSYSRISNKNVTQLPPVEEFIFKPHTPSPSKAQPSFSIMKKSNSLSPSKKSVIFEQSPPKILTYSQNFPDSSRENSIDDSFDNFTNESNDEDFEIGHGTYVGTAKQFSSIRDFSDDNEVEDDDEQTPPPLPPHHSFEDSLNVTDLEVNKLNENLNKNAIDKIKNSMSMSEKLDVFLSDSNENQIGNNQDVPKDTKSNYYDDILLHNVKLKLQQQKQQLPKDSEILSSLQNLYQSERDTQTLKRELKHETPNDIEADQEYVSNTWKTHSAQSSVTSFHDKLLTTSSPKRAMSKGLELNDGMKGFTDELMEELVAENQMLSIPKSRPPIKTKDSDVDSDGDVFEDSFDGSYNTTERSIMTLLNGSATHLSRSSSVHSRRSISDGSSNIGVVSVNKSNSIRNITPSSVNTMFVNTQMKREPQTEITKSILDPNRIEEDSVAKEDIKVDENSQLDVNFDTNSNMDLTFDNSKSFTKSFTKSFSNSVDNNSDNSRSFTNSTEFNKSINSLSFSPKSESSLASLNRSNSSIKEKAKLIQQSLQDSYEFDTTEEKLEKINEKRMVSKKGSKLIKSESFKSLRSGNVDKVVNAFNQIRLSSVKSNSRSNSISSNVSVKRERSPIISESKAIFENVSNANGFTRNVSIDRQASPPLSLLSLQSNKAGYPNLVQDEIETRNNNNLKIAPAPFVVKQEETEESVWSRAPSAEVDTTPFEIKRDPEDETQIPLESEVPGNFSGVSSDYLPKDTSGATVERIGMNVSKDSQSGVSDESSDKDNTFESTREIAEYVAKQEDNTHGLTEDEVSDELVKREHDEDILANSTSNIIENEFEKEIEDSNISGNGTNTSHDSYNITSSMNIELPKIQNSYTSFDDLTHQFDNSNDSFSSQPTDFLSIWHQKPMVTKDRTPIVHRPIPKSFQVKTGAPKSVNVLQRRVVSTNSEESYNSNVLPNLSDDSAFGDSFRQWAVRDREISDGSYAGGPAPQRKVSYPSRPNSTIEVMKKRQASNSSRVHSTSSNIPAAPIRTRSPFSAKIRRTSTTLSPDAPAYIQRQVKHERSEPTVKSSGMKTLPSMDSEDVKRILNTKRVMSQDEYAEFKLLKNKSKGVHINQNNIYDDMEQEASIIDFSDDAIILPHLADELLSDPIELMKEDRIFFDESEIELMDIDLEFDKMKQRQEKGYSVVDNNEMVIAEQDVTEDIVDENTDSFDQYHNQYIKENNAQSYPPTKSPVKAKKEPGTHLLPIDMNAKQPKSEMAGRHKSFKGHEITSKKMRSDPVVDQEPVSEAEAVKNSENSPSEKHKTVKLPVDERGRLFVRIIGLKNLDLPEISEHKAEFNLVLDNGIHCIKTNSYKLRNQVSIGQEFELTVGESLEFILTLKANYKKPPAKMVQVTEKHIVKSKNRFSRLFGAKDVVTRTKFVSKEVKDTWANRFAQDGSFARCYIDFDQYQGKVTGKPCNFDISCFNEWELIEDPVTGQITKRAPHRIGQLEVKMLFIPRTSASEVLPSSIKSAIESINELNHELKYKFEGYLYQEGGDCESWKRRFFKLEGSSLVAHSETSKKTRAKINLSKVVDVIYVDKENSSRADTGYRNYTDVMLIEHSFKLKFANGEVIDFGAETSGEKITWINLLDSILHRNRFRRQPWVKLLMSENQS